MTRQREPDVPPRRESGEPRDCVGAMFRDDVLAGQVALVVGETSSIGDAIACAPARAGAALTRDAGHGRDAFEDVLSVNLTGTMRCCTLACTKLAAAAAQRGSAAIVDTASLLSSQGGARVPAYRASKAGVAQLTKSIALAYAADASRVNVIAPGWVRTPRTQPLAGRSGAQRRAESHIARAALFLRSPAARIMTGAIVPVDGGLPGRMALGGTRWHSIRQSGICGAAIGRRRMRSCRRTIRKWAAGRTASST